MALKRKSPGIVGAHAILSSTKPDADRAFLRDVLGLPHVDAGGGWLIFGLPPSEVAVHPASENDRHELYLLCDDLRAFVAQMKKRRIRCTRVQNAGWGLLTRMRMPGGGTLGVYEPRHPRPKTVRPTGRSPEARRRPAARKS